MAKGMLSLIVGVCFAQLLYAVDDSTQRIDRYGLLNRHNVVLDSFDKMTPKFVGNGKFDSSSHVFERDVILSMMLKANAYQKTHPVMKENDRNWQRGTWYTGVMAVYRATGDVRFLQQAMDWGKLHDWQVGTEPYGANKLFCVQTWLELYSIKKDKAMIQPAIDHLASDQPNSPGGAKRWYLEGDHSYADSLYGSPALVQLYEATGDRKYMEILHAFWHDLCDELLDKEAGLFYRDRRFIGKKTPAGKNIFWSRGNGWVIGGLVRVLENMTPDEPQRGKYVERFKTMSAALARCQGDDGLWRANLADPDHFPGPESSGTGFFLYGIAWGIRNELLDKATYLPVLRKGWTALTGCLTPQGKLLYGQPVGNRPAKAKQASTHEFVTGTFLLAASEMYRLADEFPPTTARSLASPVPLLTTPIRISDQFPRIKVPGTGREALQLTSGAATCYPLYYFAPTLSKDARYLTIPPLRKGRSATLATGPTDGRLCATDARGQNRQNGASRLATVAGGPESARCGRLPQRDQPAPRQSDLLRRSTSQAGGLDNAGGREPVRGPGGSSGPEPELLLAGRTMVCLHHDTARCEIRPTSRGSHNGLQLRHVRAACPLQRRSCLSPRNDV